MPGKNSGRLGRLQIAESLHTLSRTTLGARQRFEITAIADWIESEASLVKEVASDPVEAARMFASQFEHL